MITSTTSTGTYGCGSGFGHVRIGAGTWIPDVCACGAIRYVKHICSCGNVHEQEIPNMPQQVSDTMLASEHVLRREWDTPEEDEAWKHL